MIQAYCEGFGFEGYIFRFVSILGERYTHGHVFDFYKQLLEHPDHLRVLGDGTQRKSYLVYPGLPQRDFPRDRLRFGGSGQTSVDRF